MSTWVIEQCGNVVGNKSCFPQYQVPYPKTCEILKSSRKPDAAYPLKGKKPSIYYKLWFRYVPDGSEEGYDPFADLLEKYVVTYGFASKEEGDLYQDWLARAMDNAILYGTGTENPNPTERPQVKSRFYQPMAIAKPLSQFIHYNEKKNKYRFKEFFHNDRITDTIMSAIERVTDIEELYILLTMLMYQCD